ncbi:amino acid ABC transporter substrate-binding protein [Desulfosarcina ovata subsp. sediminis]|uniref:Amino acid ABC transporter substrate-binding protein n=1 Tax=Desulfosarcina ovata subsp. sediminis TaxID=885957 RepID=A0A5K7ZXE5_9BACT|nr:transporter substrate-binding domain-containing protein [Desulfosarcina ovata]BBO84923.1 amino acid ABC transporter substrate-binding protein [Desulfosarcina ovata subsp. sediminis]
MMKTVIRKDGKKSRRGFLLAVGIVCIVVSLGLAMPSQAQDILKKIEQTGQVTMGFREGSVPFGFMNEKGEWVGFGLDLGYEIATGLNEKFGKTIELVKKPINPKTRIPLVINGTVDIGIGSTTITLAREEVVDFSLPYFLTGTRLLVPKNSAIKNFSDLAGKRVGMGSGSTANIKGIDRAMASGIIQPACEKVLFEEHNKGFLALQQGKIHAYFTDASILAGMQAKAKTPGDWKIVGQYLTYEPYGIILPENQGEWRDFVNAVLIKTIKSGRFEQIYDKWFGPKGEVPLPMSSEYKTLLQALSYPD